MKMFTEYKIRHSLIEVIKQAMKEMDITGYSVIARNQQTMTHLYDCIILDSITMKQEGFQSHRLLIDRDEANQKVQVIKRQEWIETRIFQISVTHRREVEDTLESLTAEDIANRLRAWLNSHRGARVMRGREDVPFAPMQTFNLRGRPYKDDSDQNQIEAQFDFRLQVIQCHDTDPIWITQWDWETHPI